MPQHIISPEKRKFAKGLRRKQTAPEVLLWRELRDRRLNGWKFRRQVPIEGYIADFVCFDARLVVEVDGPVHADPDQRAKDRQRDAALERNGFRVLRFPADIGPGRMVASIRETLSKPPHPTPDLRQGPPSPARGEGVRVVVAPAE